MPDHARQLGALIWGGGVSIIREVVVIKGEESGRVFCRCECNIVLLNAMQKLRLLREGLRVSQSRWRILHFHCFTGANGFFFFFPGKVFWIQL